MPAELFYFNAPTKWEKLRNTMRHVWYRAKRKAAEASARRELECFKEFYDHMVGTELLQVAVFHLEKLHREDLELWQKP